LLVGLLTGSELSEHSAFRIPHSALGASQYVETCLGLKVGTPPPVNFDAERAVQEACRTAIRRGLVDVAHDCSDGGLAVALAESCIAGRVGANITLDTLPTTNSAIRNPQFAIRNDVILFAEEPSRIIVGVPPENWTELRELATLMGASLYRLGETRGDTLRIVRGDQTLIDLAVDNVERTWRNGLS
jgi:phosphoribosylformylglycinamidine synthase